VAARAAHWRSLSRPGLKESARVSLAGAQNSSHALDIADLIQHALDIVDLTQ